MQHNKSIVSFLWKYIKPYKWYYFIMLLAPLVTSFYPFAYNYSIKLFLDIMDTQQIITYKSVMYPMVLFISAQICLDLVWRISDIAEWKSEPYVRKDILNNSYNYVQNHSYTFFQDNFTGLISSKLKGVLDGYDKFWAEMHHGLLMKLLKIVVNLLSLFFINIEVGVFVFIWGAIYLPVMYKFSLKLNKLAFSETESRHALFGQITDKITNVISIFSFSAKKRELRSLSKQITDDFIPKQLKVYKYNFMMQVVGVFLYLIMFCFVMFQMVYLKKEGLVTIGDFSFVFGITLIIAEDIWHTTVSLQDFSRAMGDFKSSLSILAVPQQNLDCKKAKDLQITVPSIEFKKLNFSYNKNKQIFANLNLVIGPGEKIGLVGRSGSGKSTLINLLLRYFKYTDGQILISDQDINQITQDSLRDNISIIPQDTMLFHRTLMENIRYGNPTATDADVISASKKAHVDEYIMQLPEQYNAYVGERGIKLSGGQRQRIAIARAILRDAPILILDEATSALDSETEKLIQESLNILIEDKNKTVIAVAHRLSTLKHMDRVIVLDNGKIIEQGSHDQLISQENSLYKKLWELQEI